MKNTIKKSLIIASLGLAILGSCLTAIAGGHMMSVKGGDPDVSNGTVTVETVMSETNGWLVIHRTDASKKPGPVVGHAPLRKGMNSQVTAILTESVKSGDMLMLMLHGEAGGNKTGIFEYTLGAKEDGPVKNHGKLVMEIMTAE